MKLCRYGNDQLGVVKDAMVHDVTDLQTRIRASVPYTYWGDPVVAFVHSADGIKQLTEAAEQASPVPLASVKLLSPVVRSSKVIGAPTNYKKHIDEMAAKRAELKLGYTADIGQDGLFLKSSSAVIGPSEGMPIRFPERRTDHEGEIVIVIGKQGSDIPMDLALDYVAGYSLGLDMVLRGREDRSFRKSPDGYAVLGPWLTTSDEIADPESLPFQLSVNGDVRQDANTEDLVYGIKRLVEFAASFYTLYPGDLIYTGTPAGVGPVVAGDLITVTSAPLGTLEIAVVSRQEAA